MYTVPAITPDLRHEETIIQATIALDTLKKTINSVFERIDARILKNNAKVKELNERISRAQKKIEGLVGSKKAIKIYSPARFPSTHILERKIEKTFNNYEENATTTMEDKDAPMKFHMEPNIMEPLADSYEVESPLEDVPIEQMLKDKLIFFHVRGNQDQENGAPNGTIAAERLKVNKNHGLGELPTDLRSVSSLLLFNTDAYVYGSASYAVGSSSSSSDALHWKRAKEQIRLQSQQRQKNAAARQQIIEAAPHSLAHRNQKQTPAGELRYTPRFHQTPEINLPFDLPDLPGIADDIIYEQEELAQQQIAPSLFADALPDLPELQAAAAHEEKQQLATMNIPATADILQPPPPPPPPSALETKSEPTPTIALIATAAAPPPPPPPPPASTHMKAPTATHIKAPTTTAVIADTRSELMDAIRKAGGVRGGRLRSAAAAPVDAVDQASKTANKQTTGKTVGGDLMADLHNKLLMRRKGISGAKDRDGNTNLITPSGNSVISRLSALIPPPQTREEDSDEPEESSEADWND